ncbi:MAG: metal-dependent hydrolase [Methanoregulaceae archaeon]|nr:metal-dependent hydrolase [Methanoregulaceae archaeon]
MELTYLGHSCVLLKGKKTVLVDPFSPELEIPPSPDIVAVTHGHADHMGSAVALKRPTVAINEVAKYLKSKGIPAEGMNIGGTILVEGVTFHMVQAIHSSWIEEAGIGCNGGGAAGFVIGMEGRRVYHAGDTALFSDMKLIGELCHPDVALLPIGGRFTMGPEEAMIAARYIGAPLVIPIHYDTWPVIRQDPKQFRTALERTTDIRVRILSPGEKLTI